MKLYVTLLRPERRAKCLVLLMSLGRADSGCQLCPHHVRNLNGLGHSHMRWAREQDDFASGGRNMAPASLSQMRGKTEWA
jgi:hypothetical protein